MALWGKSDNAASKPKYLKLNPDGSVAQDASGRKLIFVDNEEAALDANKAKGITGAGWYLVSTSGSRTKAELLIAIADAPREVAGVVVDDSDDIETDLELENP